MTALQYLAHPWNALLMGAFVSFSLYHAALGLQVVIDDYIHTAGSKIFLTAAHPRRAARLLGRSASSPSSASPSL